MSDAANRGSGADHRSLAATLAPVLINACDDRLGPISWFKADWQRGGAATGTSIYTNTDGTDVPVVVKLPVVRRELTWLQRLQPPEDSPSADRQDPVVPKLFASGDTLGGYDLTWVIIEHFPHGPLGLRWHENHIPRIADAIAKFHANAARYPVDRDPKVEPWHDLLTEAMDSVKLNCLPPEQEWLNNIRTVRSRLDRYLDIWNARDTEQWLHGDLHLANAMSRHDMDSGTVSLIDLAEVHAGHWIEDAVYLERQLWARPERLKECPPVKAIAKARRAHDLPVEQDYPTLAMVRRALLAATAPKFLKSEGHPIHLEACLNWLTRALDELK